MKKRLNRTQQTRFLLYLIYFLILGILLLVGKLKLNFAIILFLVVEIIFHKYKSWRNKRFYHASINIVDKMTGEEFEEFLELHFKKEGYKTHLTPKTGDYGADLVVKKGREKIVVQAKRWNQNVGVEAVQQAVASIKYYKAHRAMVITNSSFTENARNLAKANNVTLIDRKDILKLTENNENCPICNSRLQKKEGKYGYFYGCTNYPKCKYTKSL